MDAEKQGNWWRREQERKTNKVRNVVVGFEFPEQWRKEVDWSGDSWPSFRGTKHNTGNDLSGPRKRQDNAFSIGLRASRAEQTSPVNSACWDKDLRQDYPCLCLFSLLWRHNRVPVDSFCGSVVISRICSNFTRWSVCKIAARTVLKVSTNKLRESRKFFVKGVVLYQ